MKYTFPERTGIGLCLYTSYGNKSKPPRELCFMYKDDNALIQHQFQLVKSSNLLAQSLESLSITKAFNYEEEHDEEELEREEI
jgi:hypothetical protein